MRVLWTWLLVVLAAGPLTAQKSQSEAGSVRPSDRDRLRSGDEAQKQPGAGQESQTPGARPPSRPTQRPRGGQEEPGDEDLDDEARQRRIRQFYPARPKLPTPQPELEGLLDEIEDEVIDLLPLYGQRIFRQAILERALQQPREDQPVATPPPSYQVLPGDRVIVTFWNAFVPPTQVEAQVHSDGTVGFDPVGVVQVAGLTVGEFESLLTNLIRRKGPKDARVRISYTALHAVRVSVRGEVRRVSAGVVLSGYATLFDALAAVGGPTAFASLRNIKLFRAGQTQTVDLYQFLLAGEPAANLSLRDGDSIHVPVAERVVSVEGDVARPARYELANETKLLEAVALAGGQRGRAAKVQVSRVEDYTRETLHDFALAALLAGQADTRAVEPLRHGDRIELLEVGNVKEVITVKGAVGRAGEYGYEPGLTLGAALDKAQGILRDGHVAVGTIRRARPDGQVESINFEVADVVAKGPAAALPLQAGDLVEVPLAEERAPLTVVISGAVNEPGSFRMQTAHTVADLIQKAAGLAPGAAASGTLLSTAGGAQQETRLDLSAMARGGEPQPNPTLANGDRVIVPFLSETGAARQVRAEGFVRSPGSYALTAGMRVKDLLDRAGGVLPRAATRGRLVRVVPGTNDTVHQYLDLTKAAKGDPEHNVELREDDLLAVSSAAAILSAVEPMITISGPVAQPGRYTRAVGMRVSDLVTEAGGLRPEADRDQATLLRLTEEGRVRRLRLNPARAMAGSETDDLELRDGDVLELVSWREVRASRPEVRTSGAVYSPGTFPLTQDMTLDDLLFLAGGPTPDAYLPRAELHRRAADGRTSVVPVDLAIKPLLLPLQESDELKVYTHEQALYREPTVEIKGEVQHPGKYERGLGMTLSELIFRAGGLTRNAAFSYCEVARARDTRVTIYRPDLLQLLKGDRAQDLELADGDAVFVQTLGDYQHRPREVLVRGRVALPGFFPLSGTDESLRSLLTERARGLLDGAFVEGAVLLRRVEQIVDPEVARYGTQVYQALRAKKQKDDYTLALSKSVPNPDERLFRGDRVIPTQLATSDLATVLGQPELSAAAADLQERDRDRFQPPAEGGPKPAEKPDPADEGLAAPEALRPYVRVALDLQAVLDGRQDLRLCPNDVLIVPEQPQLILVVGEIASNMAQPFVERGTVDTYLARAGGLTNAADAKGLLVVRANGTVSKAQGNTRIARGDLIVAPPKPLTLPREKRAMEDIQAIASILGGVATTMVAINQAFD